MEKNGFLCVAANQLESSSPTFPCWISWPYCASWPVLCLTSFVVWPLSTSTGCLGCVQLGMGWSPTGSWWSLHRSQPFLCVRVVDVAAESNGNCQCLSETIIMYIFMCPYLGFRISLLRNPNRTRLARTRSIRDISCDSVTSHQNSFQWQPVRYCTATWLMATRLSLGRLCLRNAMA